MHIFPSQMKHWFFCLMFAGLVVWLPAQAGAETPPSFILQWGTPGSGPGEFDFPRRLAVHESGIVYVSDRNNARIQKFTSEGVFITSWGSPGSGEGEFDFPFGVAVDATNSFVYVAERNNNRIQKFTSDGTYLTQWGGMGSGPGQFNYPIAVDVAPSGNVYVGDSFNHRIQEFSPDGAYIRSWGSEGNLPGQFVNPIGIAVASSGHVYVGDSGNHRVQKFTSGGAFLLQWGSFGTGDGQFASPRGIGVDADGNVYVADTINNRIQKFASNGTFLTTWGTGGSGPGQFNRPEDAEVDGMGNVYVVDPSNNRVEKFGRPAVPVTLSALDAQRRGDVVVLTWRLADPASTAIEFDIYRQGQHTARTRLNSDRLSGRMVYEFEDTSAPRTPLRYWLYVLTPEGGERVHGPLQVDSAPISTLSLDPAHPNPFNPTTTIHFTLPTDGHARLSVFDAGGHRIRTLLDGNGGAGEHSLSWSGRDDSGAPVASGVYFVNLESNGQSITRTVVLIK